MKSIDVELSEELEAQLNAVAAELGMTPPELARQAIEAHLGSHVRRFAGAGADWTGREQVTERIEEILGGQVIR